MKLCFKNFFIVLLIFNLAIMQIPINIFAFGNKSHEELSVRAFNNVVRNFDLSEFADEAHDIIQRYCTNPDRKETGSSLLDSYKKHFFNVTEDDLKGDNAYSSMLYHYNSSIEHAKNKEWILSLQELAQALHFLQDICCPVHMWGYNFNRLRLDLHTKLEAEWDAMWWSDKVSMYLPIATRLEDCRFTSPEGLGLDFSHAALDKWRTWIENKKSAGKHILPALNWVGALIGQKKKDPFYDKHVDPDKGFREGWKNIFQLPYLASYELVLMWVNTVRQYNPPPPVRGVCKVQ